MKDLLQKFGKRTFAAPALGVGFAVVNEGAQMGYDFKTCALVVAASLLWAAIETWRDTTMMKHGLWHKPVSPSVTTNASAPQ